MINENELAKELTDTLNKDVAMPKAAALHLKPNGGRAEPATLTWELDQIIAGLQNRINYLEKLKSTL